ncbi:KAP family P-loop NTPase fold protein [Curtobacterium sp. 8I-2]|uniref:KAP family P-loop NTPase fold protein n=1 Tax=Curtobacterium sp. 8I-2 TaxID=2653136 RepID=UPI0012F34DA5|nr:P-loop NTPase fold protein [Curtobacterium sp. 8I-2]VXC06303.1 conserved hypothetical protein [Curtobacterium sp. 8I-2]
MSTPGAPLDNPIGSSDDDTLGRAPVAREFAESVRLLDASRGAVVGILGAWGSGKTSFVNMMREEFRSAPEMPVIEFNPWLFSGTQQLSEAFFREISAALRVSPNAKLGTIADNLEKYGDVLSPLAMLPYVGAWYDRSFKAAKTATRLIEDRRRGTGSLKQDVTSELKKLPQPVVVVIDDIDRLTTPEIRDVFKLVRLTANFANVIYLLAFDRHRVEAALSEDGIPGRDYLEKIVQVSLDLPAVSEGHLRSQVSERLGVVVQGIENLRFSSEEWADVYFDIVEPMISNLRDVTRFVLSAQGTLRALGADIEAVDLLALEAIRVFRPDIFRLFEQSRRTLTTVSAGYGSQDLSKEKLEVSRILEAAGPDADAVNQLLTRLFPAAQRYMSGTHYGADFSEVWKRNHRVAHIAYADLYFGRLVSSELLAARWAEGALEAMSDRCALASHIEAIPPEQIEDALIALGALASEFRQEMVIPSAATLLSTVDLIPERDQRGMFDMMRPDLVVSRVVLQLLRLLPTEPEREAAVEAILLLLNSYSSQELLLRDVGHQENVGAKLISVAEADRLEHQFVASVMAKHSDVPSREFSLLRVYWIAGKRLGDRYVPPTFENVDEIRSLLRSGRTVARSQTSGSRHVRTEARLWWDGLIGVFGGEAPLRAAVVRLEEVDGQSPLVELGMRYAAGWRPDDE